MRFLLFLEPVAKNDTPLVISLHQNIKNRITLNERKTRTGRNVCPCFSLILLLCRAIVNSPRSQLKVVDVAIKKVDTER